MSNLVEILVTAKNLTGPAMAAVNAEVEGASKKMALFHKTALLAGAGIAVIGIESVKMASKFDSEMTLLQTQAGVSKDKIAGLKSGVLGLAGKVGQDPDSLAEALFHVESNFSSMGITSSNALKLTETAAKGATVGHADLVDVTNALTAAVASGIPGVQNLDQAMGVLNATVGSGDMKMQDLANAFGSGMVATVKGFGLSITDVGAALATFGDNNIRGALAGNQLRMSVMALAKPVPSGEGTLNSIGLQMSTLAKDMQKGGLKLGLEDLVAHMKAAGITSQEQGALITNAFGRKAGAGLNILVGQMDRLESKYPEITKGAKTFSQSWEDTKKTFAFQMKSLETGFQALMIGIGEKIIPPLQSFIGFLKEHKTATIGATKAMGGLLVAAVALSVALKTIAGAKLAWGALTDGAKKAQKAFLFLRTEMTLMSGSFIAAGGGARGLAAGLGALSTGTKVVGAIAIVGTIALVAKHFSDEAKQAKISGDEMALSLKGLAAGGGGSATIVQLGKDISNLHQSLGEKLKSNDSVWDLITNSGAKTSSAKKDLNQLGSTLADMVKNGDSDRAALALKRITDAGVKVPTKYLKDYRSALSGVTLDSELTAESQGKFGEQAQEVQAQLDVQAASAKGLMDSLQALDQVNQDAYNGETKLYDAMAAGADIAKKKGASLNINTDAGRRARDAMTAIAAATDSSTAAFAKQSTSWDKVNSTYAKGYNALVADAMQLGLNRDKAKAYADSLLQIPEDVRVKGDIGDLESKIKKAKSALKSVPPSKRAALQANIADLEAKVVRAKWDLAQLKDKNITITTFLSSVYSGPQLGGLGGHAAGGMAAMGETSWVGEQGPELMQVTPLGTRIFSNADSKKLAKLNGIQVPGYAKGTVSKAQQAAIDRASAEKEARGDALGYLNVSHFGQAAGYKQTSFAASTSSPGSVADLVATLTEWQAKIKAATHGAQETKLVAAFDKFGKAALKNEAALLAVNGKLDSAKDKLSTLKDSFAQLQSSVRDSVVSYGSIAKGGAGNSLGVVEQLQGSVDQAKRFAADLAKLKASGLNSQSLTELAQAGVDGGLGTADALAGSSPAYIKKINDLEKQLVAAGGTAGTVAANSEYGAGIATAQALVAGLQKQQAAINKVMATAAAAMAAQLKKSLSGKASGGTVGAAATGGNRWGRTLVGEYAPELVDLPIGSRVHSGPDSERMIGGSGASSQPIYITVMVGPEALGTAMIDPLRGVIKNRGGNVQVVLGQRGK